MQFGHQGRVGFAPGYGADMIPKALPLGRKPGLDRQRCRGFGQQRTVLVAEMRGLPQDEIARRLGSNRNAVYKVCHDARRALVRSLVAGGVTSDEVRWMFDQDMGT